MMNSSPDKPERFVGSGRDHTRRHPKQSHDPLLFFPLVAFDFSGRLTPLADASTRAILGLETKSIWLSKFTVRSGTTQTVPLVTTIECCSLGTNHPHHPAPSHDEQGAQLESKATFHQQSIMIDEKPMKLSRFNKN